MGICFIILAFDFYLSGVRPKPDSPETAETDLVHQMPFTKRSTYTLTLAISAAIMASYATAETAPSEAEMAWSCSMSKDGEWDCSVNEDLVNQVESSTQPPSGETAQSPVEEVATEANPSNRTVPAPPTRVSSKAISAEPEQKQQATTATRPSTTPNTTVTTSAAIRRPATSSQVTSNQSGVWDCVAGPNGEWLCNGEQTSVASKNSGGTEINQQVAQPAAVSPNTPIVTNEVLGSEWQCSTSATGDWDCHKVNVHAIAMPGRTGSSGASGPLYITENPYSHLDWVYYQNPQAQQCSGRYLEPEFPVMGDEHLENPPMYLEAGQSSTVIGGLTTLQGGVNVRQGSKRFSSSSAELDQVTNKARLEGNVSFREPGLLMLSDTAQVDTSTSEAIFNNAQYVLHEEGLRGRAQRIIRLEDERLRLEQGDYTYCPPYSEAWQLSSDNIVLNKEEGYGEAEDAVLRIAGIPVLYTPYFTFPIDDTRRSGFLYPSAGYSKESGVDLSVPYYFNIAPNLDDTLTTRYLSDRGLILENELRYLNPWSDNILNTAYMPDDDVLGDNRWLLGVEHKGTFAKHWHSEIDYTAVSDEDYFDDLGTNLEISRQDHLDKRAQISYLRDNWVARIKVHDYQTIDSSSKAPYKRLPQLTLKGEEALSENVNFSLNADITRFDRNLAGLTGSDRVIGDRRHLMPSLSYLWQTPGSFIKPTLSLWSSSYSLENQVAGFSESPSVNAHILSIDSGLIFERDLDNGGIQTLEPRLFALHVPHKDQSAIPDFDASELDFSYASLFRRNRFSGLDRLGDTQQLSLGLSTRFIGQQGVEKASFSIGQAYYFADRNVQLDSTKPAETDSQSDIATEAVWYLSPDMRISWDAVFDHSDFDGKESNLRLRYNSDLNHRFDFSYRYEESSREQTDLSFIWPVSRQWTTMGRWLYDLQDEESLETSLGLEYESCCWTVNFAGRRWLDDTDQYDTGIFLNFTLKGLGSFGSGSSDFMNDIIGYKEREEHYEK
ncbi:organic solvent tolerance protein, putative [Oceanospirillum sp. MED92]|uniref:LPS-assembly protein LptD n=2 Tax=Neptuniibacter caesariensis TaxID=207954 RepID=A0A7U8C6M5_NEPCE|nr:organic solvent tolerance protein, putative [Oceanospirillum sp. MED92] [Neptuniibacter caesariensis]